MSDKQSVKSESRVCCRFDVCDGSTVTRDFMALQGADPTMPPRGSLDLPQGLVSAAEDVRESEQKVDLQSVLNNITASTPDPLDSQDPVTPSGV